MNESAITPEDAFEVLQAYLQEKITEAQDIGADSMQAGNYKQAREALAKLEQLSELLQNIDNLEQDFNRLVEVPEQQAESSRLRKGMRTPEDAYFIPILKALVKMGGSVDATKVLDDVYEEMVDQLNQHDLAMLPSERDFRWRNTAMWARYSLVKQGLLANNSPRGVWEISDEGRRWLEERE